MFVHFQLQFMYQKKTEHEVGERQVRMHRNIIYFYNYWKVVSVGEGSRFSLAQSISYIFDTKISD